MNYTPYIPRRDYAERTKEKIGDKGELIGFYKDEEGHHYRLVKFYKCGHECYIGTGNSLECKNKDCLYEKMSKIRKISHNRPEVKAKMTQINIENNAKPEVKEKHKRIFKQYWGNEENKKKQSNKKAEFFSIEKNRKTHSETLKEYYATHEEYKKEITARLTDWRNLATDEEIEAVNIKRIKTMNTPERREKTSANFREYYSDIENKKQYLNRVVKQQRNRKNKFEMIFKKLLDDHGIDYVWQYPLITEDGKGFVIDFYLPDYELYVNIDGSCHGFNGKIKNPIVDMHVASDDMLNNYCEQHGLNIVHVDTRDLKGLNFDLREVIGT